jgi:hypothetical protein
VICISDSTYSDDQRSVHWQRRFSPPQCLNSYLMGSDGDHQIGDISKDVEKAGINQLKGPRAWGRTLCRFPDGGPEEDEPVYKHTQRVLAPYLWALSERLAPELSIKRSHGEHPPTAYCPLRCEFPGPPSTQSTAPGQLPRYCRWQMGACQALISSH